MGYISDETYYDDSANYGSYQYVSLVDIVNNFTLMNTGNHSIVNNVPRHLILFHAKRAIQELHYDAFKEVRVLQMPIDDQLKFILPPDYVNWVRISIYKDNVLLPLSENIHTISSKKYDTFDGDLVFDDNGNVIPLEDTQMVTDRLSGVMKDIYLNENSPMNGQSGYCVDGNWYFVSASGGRYGLNTETANSNPTFKINARAGVIDFSSGVEGESCILEYISDGMERGNDAQISVNKLFESYIYAYIQYEIISKKLGVQEYIVTRARKERTALLRNAKIRISNMHPGRLLMNLRGQNKIIK